MQKISTKETLMSGNIQAIVLAAGKSTGFKTGKTKLIEKLCGQEMILYTTNLLQHMHVKTYIVVGYQKEHIEQIITQEHGETFEFIEQENQHGTAHAILCSNKKWEAENIIVLHADMPLITEELINALYKKHIESQSALTFVTSHVADPSHSEYARVIKNDRHISIVQPSELSDDINEHCCIDAGLYIIKKTFLEKHLETIQKSQDSKEFHINDIINIANQYTEKISTLSAPFDIIRGINTLQELWAVEQIKRSELIRYWMDNGVRFSVAQNVHIDLKVQIGKGSFIGGGVHLKGNTQIGNNSSIMEFSVLEDSIIGDSVTIEPHCVIKNAVINNDAFIGPFAHIRENTQINEKVCIGNFVEVKNSIIGKESLAKHLSYLGDAQIAQQVNIGAGTITCNYDGQKKHKTIIQERAFIGSNSTLIAPVEIKHDAYVAAGSTITHEVPAHALAIARTRQINKEEYAKKIKAKKQMSAESISFLPAKKTKHTINTSHN